MLLLLSEACAPPPLPTVDTTPSITITWPPAESEIQGCTTVAVDIENLILTDFTVNTENEEGHGHWHVFHPAGYAASWKPFQFVDFSSVTETTEPYLTVQLANNDHSDLLDAEGEPYTFSIPFTFVPGPCESDTGGAPADTAGDTGGGS